jgi:isopenicillin-N epimerase
VNQQRIAPPKPSPFRRHWKLKPGIVFLNHGSFGACPRFILDLQARLRDEMEGEPVQFLWRRYEERLEPARVALARFVGARPRDLVFVTNATTAVNAVVRSAGLRRGDEVLTTSLDYNACRNALVQATGQAGAKLSVARIPFPIQHPEQVVTAVMSAVTPRTRLAMIDHVTSDSALVLPVARLVRELAARGVDVLVDGAHAPGMVSVNLKALGAAYYTGNLHKWVCAPKGAAFLSAREDKQAALQPAVISHGNNRPRPGYTPFQDRFDWAGTSDVTAWFCIGEAIRWLGDLLPGGWADLRRRNHALALDARRRLSDRFGVEPACPDSMIGSMATIPLPERFQGTPAAGRIDPEQLELYDRFGIEAPFSRIGPKSLRCLRVSAHIYNTRAEYDYLGDAMEQLGDKRK